MVVRYNEPTCIWFNIKYKIFKAVDIINTYVSLNSSFGGRPTGMIEVVAFEKITDDFYWFTTTNGKHVGLHICDFTMPSSLCAINAKGVADALSTAGTAIRELSNSLTSTASTATSNLEPFRATTTTAFNLQSNTDNLGYSVTTYSNNIL